MWLCTDSEGLKNGEGAFEPPKPVSQFNGLANRKQSDASRESAKALRLSAETPAHPFPTDSCQTNPGLAGIMDAWESLDKAVKTTILMLVRASQKREGD